MNVHLLVHVQFSELYTCPVSYIHAGTYVLLTFKCHKASDIKKKLTLGSGLLYSKWNIKLYLLLKRNVMSE
jgi:hypothetical protein